MTAAWQKAEADALEGLRVAYMADLNRLAETLRPRFESGELYGYRDDETNARLDEAFRWREAHPGFTEEERAAFEKSLPPWAPEMVEEACAAFFGLDEAHEERDFEATFRRASLLRAVSPGDSTTLPDGPVIPSAVMAISADVFTIARVRGWYTRPDGEGPTEEDTGWVQAAA